MRNIRSLIMAVTLLQAGLTGCDGNSSVSINANSLKVPVPGPIRQIAAIGDYPLELQISINNEIKREVPVQGPDIETISVVVNVPADQNNEVDIAWYAIFNGSKILLADFSTTSPQGSTVLNIGTYNNTGARFDADNDGRTNLDEAQENRNMLSEIDLTVPLQTTFGGAFEDLHIGAPDPDTSGETIETDQFTSFSLRHTGTDLIAYVCGRDQTLQGDNLTSDGQYWHDDVVFMFIDGADSDNATYDTVDDFQFGFVRESGEMIVSKGGGNQFCPNGACVSHTFFSNSTSCEYELTVTFSMADLNITAGQPVGFDIEITDDDNGGLREGSSAWIGYDDRSDQKPSTFGTILLE